MFEALPAVAFKAVHDLCSSLFLRSVKDLQKVLLSNALQLELTLKIRSSFLKTHTGAKPTFYPKSTYLELDVGKM